VGFSCCADIGGRYIGRAKALGPPSERPSAREGNGDGTCRHLSYCYNGVMLPKPIPPQRTRFNPNAANLPVLDPLLIYGPVAITNSFGRAYLKEDIAEPGSEAYFLAQWLPINAPSNLVVVYIICDGDNFYYCDFEDEDTADHPAAPTICFDLPMKMWAIDPPQGLFMPANIKKAITKKIGEYIESIGLQ
jgi:hypothetical protein